VRLIALRMLSVCDMRRVSAWFVMKLVLCLWVPLGFVSSMFAGECLAVPVTSRVPEAGSERNTILVVGSSTAQGSGASRYSRSWAGLLQAAVEPEGMRLVNVSIPAFGTEQMKVVLLEQLQRLRPRVVILAVNIYNEGIVERPIRAVSTFQRNTQEMIAAIEQSGAIPVLTSMIPNARYNATIVQEVRSVNQWIDSLGRPTIDFWGAVSDSSGQWVRGGSQDGTHPTDQGHFSMFDAVDGSMIDFWIGREGRWVEPCEVDDRRTGWVASSLEDSWLSLASTSSIRSWHLRVEFDEPAKDAGQSTLRSGELVAWYSKKEEEWVEQLTLRCEGLACSLMVDNSSVLEFSIVDGRQGRFAVDLSFQEFASVLAVHVTREGATYSGNVKLDRPLDAISGIRVRPVCTTCGISNVSLHRTPRLAVEDRESYGSGALSIGSLVLWAPITKRDHERGLVNRVSTKWVIGATGEWQYGF
jgi:lysophospholipase L1-like esterase